jgi:hypothetical protein
LAEKALSGNACGLSQNPLIRQPTKASRVVAK